MNSNLSASNYIRNNKKTVGVLVIALALSFVVLYVIHVLLITTTESFKPIMLEMPKRLSYASISAKTYGIDVNAFNSQEELEAAYNDKQNELIEKLKNHPGIEDAFYTQIISSYYQSVVGGWSYELPLMEPERIPEFLKHMDAELIEGRMPEGDGEILIDSVVLKNQSMSVGDWYRENVWGETFKIVGVIRSDYMVSVGTPMGYSNSGWYMVVLNDETATDMKKILSEQGIEVTENDEISDAVEYKSQYEKECKEIMENTISVIFIVVMIFIAISVLVAYVSFMRNRVNEYCLYASIGYGRSGIYGMIMREMLLIFGISVAAGLIISIIAANVINNIIIIPKGLINKVYYPEIFFRIAAMFVLIMGILQLPVLLNINGIKTIDAIED